MHMHSPDGLKSFAARLIAFGMLCGWGPFAALRAAAAAEGPAPAASQYITLSGAIDQQTLVWVREAGLELQNQASAGDRQAVLVLEVAPGNSQFHEVYGLARFLTSDALSRVRTIAWIPETVVGNNVLAALACKEIVMHPDAQLGDIGRGSRVDDVDQTIAINMVAKRYNPKVNQALATAMMNPQAALIQLTLETADGMSEKRLVTEAEAAQMRDAGVVIKDSRMLKEPGQPGVFSGAQARNNDFLVMQTVANRHDLAAAYQLPLEALREQPQPGRANRVSLIEVAGTIDPFLESFLERQIDRAVAEGTEMIIFQITSPGGLLWQSRDLAYAIADLEDHNIRTVAFVPNHALSGAAIIALGCDEIYLTPGGTFGDAGPIEIRDGQQFERAPEKVLSLLREIMRELGERKGRPPALLMAMADKDLQVYEARNKQSGEVTYMSEEELHQAGDDWEQGRLVAETAGNLLLTVNGRRAHELQIAERPVDDFEELKSRLGIPEDVQPHKIGRTWLDDTVFILNTNVVTGLLFFVGIICIYLELHFMSGILGIVSALCFGLFFWSKFLGGTAGWLEVLLFLLGIGCLALEVFVIPGFGVFGVSGALLLFVSLIMASHTFGNDILRPNQDLTDATWTMVTLSTSIIAVIAVATALSRFLPRIPFLNRMILTPPGIESVQSPGDVQLRPDLAEGGSLVSLVGEQGETLTVLRPAGKARVAGRLLDVVSDGPYIPQGRTVEVVLISGNRVVVREA
ncbi:MAG: NfeD family protein [Planctomycetaceae bacterium]